MVIYSFLFFFLKLDAVSWENHLVVSTIEGLDICGPAIPLLSAHARAGSANHGSQATFCFFVLFLPNKILLEIRHLICMACACFYSKRAELSGCHRDHKARNLKYLLTSLLQSLPTLTQRHFYSLILLSLITFFFLHWVFVAAHELSLVVLHELLIATGSLVGEPGLQRTGSVVVAHGLSCSEACRIFPDQGSHRYLLDARQMLNCWATREAPTFFMDFIFQNSLKFTGKLRKQYRELSHAPAPHFPYYQHLILVCTYMFIH